MKHIYKEWLSFSKEALPMDAPKNQYDDMKIAFYAGSTVLFNLLMERAKDANVSPEEGKLLIAVLHQEIKEFLDDPFIFHIESK